MLFVVRVWFKRRGCETTHRCNVKYRMSATQRDVQTARREIRFGDKITGHVGSEPIKYAPARLFARATTVTVHNNRGGP